MFEKDTVHRGQRDKAVTTFSFRKLSLLQELALHVQSQSLNAMKKIFDTEN